MAIACAPLKVTALLVRKALLASALDEAVSTRLRPVCSALHWVSVGGLSALGAARASVPVVDTSSVR